MKRIANRAILGNGCALLTLAVLAGALLRLHDIQGWRLAPPPHRWLWAAPALLAYAGLCVAVAWSARRRRSAEGLPAAAIPVIWASQTGVARALAERTALTLRTNGVAAHAIPMQAGLLERLQGIARALFVVSTTGEGDAPDHAQSFDHPATLQTRALPHLQYAILALGDRRYERFCAFGRRLEAWLQAQGAQALCARLEVDNAEPAALQRWQDQLAQFTPTATWQHHWSTPTYQAWRLETRTRMNPGSAGAPVYRLCLHPLQGPLPHWNAGDIAEIAPCHSRTTVERWLQRQGMDGEQKIDGVALHVRLATLQLPDTIAPATPAATLLAALSPLPHRDYSIASIPQEGRLELLVRQHVLADGQFGLGSGWLCIEAPLGTQIALRIRSNPGFHPPLDPATPLLLIGNGTGIAGLRALLRARIAAGAAQNWLVFGERNAAHDALYGDTLRQWQNDGWIARLDTVYSRDGGGPRYVQEMLAIASAQLRAWVAAGAVLYACGSLRGMAPAVEETLRSILGQDALKALQRDGRYRRDVY